MADLHNLNLESETLKLKLLATSIIAATAIAGVAAAQDANTWTGFYAGVYLGGAWQTGCASVDISSPAGDASQTVASSCPHPAHFIGGGQFGYNYQFANSHVVLGLEAGIGGGTTANESYTLTTAGNATIPAGTYTLSGAHTPGAIGEIRARLGYDFGGKALVYFTGGGVFATSTGTPTLSYTDGLIPPNTATFSPSGNTSTRTGWGLGGGLEYKLTPNWSVKGEDIFFNTGNASPPTVCADTVNGTVCHEFGVGPVTIKSSGNSGNANVFRIGVNYKFF